MAVYTAEQYRNRDMPTSTSAGDLLAIRAKFIFPSAVTLAAADVIRLAQLPPNFGLVGIELDNDALGTACVGSVGLLTSDETAIAASAITAANLATAGLKLTNDSAARRVAINPNSSTTIGLVVTTAASAALSIGATVGVVIYYRPKQSVE